MKIPFFKKEARLTPEDIADEIRAGQEGLDDLENQRPGFLAALMEAEESGNADAIDAALEALARLSNRTAAARQKIENLRSELMTALEARQGGELADLERNLQNLEEERQRFLTEAVRSLARATYLIMSYAPPGERTTIWQNLPVDEILKIEISRKTKEQYPWPENFQEALATAATDFPAAGNYRERRGYLRNFEVMLFNPVHRKISLDAQASRLLAAQEGKKCDF